jgi:hypothetical protein
VNGTLRPSPFVSAFLERCRRDRLPLDFFSWHVYTNDPREPAERARAVRRLLDESGFRSTESHLNEWNYLPDRDWAPVLRGGQGEPRQRFYDRVGGAEGAAFVAAALIHLQDAPLDAANYYSADTKGFGLFTPSGVPKKTYHALRAFAMLLETPVRVQASAGDLPVCAGVDEAGELLTVLVSNPSGEDRLVDVVADEMWVLDAAHDLERVAVERTVRLRAHSVCVVRRRLRG